MEKEIKDYLHLYFNSEITWRGYIYPASHLVKGLLDEPEIGNCKLILRPLSDMIGEEVRLFFNLEEQQKLIDFKIHDTFIEINYVEKYAKESIFYHQYFSGLSPRQFHYLLSKHFDIFNLIPEGLAIDKSSTP